MRVHYRKFTNRTIIVVAIGLTLFYVAALYATFDRQHLSRDEILSHSFLDTSLNLLAGRLIQEGAFYVTEQGSIAMNDSLLMKVVAERYPSGPAWLRRFDENDRMRAIKRDVSFIKKNYEKMIYVHHGQLKVDANATKQSFRGNIAGREIVVRGTIRDRENRVLAVSTMGTGQKGQRRYPSLASLFSIVGMDHPVFGKHLLEAACDPYLSGTKGGVSQQGSAPLMGTLYGADIILTLDSLLQQECYALMEEKKYKGAVVILDAKTGEILAAVSSPAIDGSLLGNDAWRSTVKHSPDDLIANRCFSRLYFPGSIFKVVVTAAWLESPQMRPDFSVQCTGRLRDRNRIRCTGNHGTIGLARGFAQSCNQLFSELAVLLGREVSEYARKFGIDGQPLNVIPQLSGAHFDAVPSLGIAEGFDFKNNKGLVAQAGIGQNLIKMTPVAAARMMTPFANQGKLVAPYLVREIRNAEGKQIIPVKPMSPNRVISPKTASRILGLMERVMTQGTGKEVKKIQFDGRRYRASSTMTGQIIPVAGKTGTAQVGTKRNGRIEDKPHSWFVGIVPADKPRFIIALVLENQGYGAAAAAPLAMEMLTAALNMKKTRSVAGISIRQ